MKETLVVLILGTATNDAMKDCEKENGAQLWIKHELEQNAKVPKERAFVQ